MCIMDNLALLETGGAVMKDGLAARKRSVLRGNEGDRLSRTDRLEDNYEETREERDAKTFLSNEHHRISEELRSKDKIDFDSSDSNRKDNSSKSNYKLISTNTSVRAPSSEPDPSRSSASSSLSPISDNVYEPSMDNTGRIDSLSHKHGYRHQQQTRDDHLIDDRGGGKSIKDIIVMGILIGLLVILVVNTVFLVYKPVVRFFKRKFRRLSTVHQTIIERRYKTIDKWLIQKTVQPHDDTCRNIQNYARLQNGESSLGRYASTTSHSKPTTFQATEYHPPLCLTSSFDTRTTHDCSSSSSSTSSLSSSNRNGTGDFVSNCIIESDDDINNTIYIEEIKNTTISNHNQSINKASSPVEFEIEHDENRQQASKKEISTLPLIHASSISDEETAVESQSVFLTREEIFEKMEITKPTKQKPKNVAYQHSQVPQIFEKSDDERKAGCSSHEEEDEKDPKQECSICMEGFEVGDKVSFSPAEGCHHVFHHDCLRQWLLRKADCPCCRVIMLPIDRPKPKDHNEPGNDEVAPPTAGFHPHRRRNRRARQLLQLQHQHTDKPRNYKNTKILRERLNKKCGTYCCVACGVVVLKTDLREDLCTKATPLIWGNGEGSIY